MTKEIHYLDADGNPLSVTAAADCTVFIGGVDPEQEHSVTVIDTNNESEKVDYIGAGVKK